MQRKRQLRRLPFHIISFTARAASAIAVVFALTVVLTQSAQAQTPAAGVAWSEKVLHSFGNGTDGSTPFAGLIFDAAGNLYGTTYLGGTYSGGTVFELTPTGGGAWTETVLHGFPWQGTGGAYPTASLIFDAAGNLYGTTYGGGSNYCVNGCGTAFELTPTAGGGWAETVLYSFCPQPQGGVCPDGAFPDAGLIFDAAGNLYGTTGNGGPYGYGTVFELTPTAGGGWTETVLHSFNRNGVDGFGPSGVIFDAEGNLYGTTAYGGTTTYGSDSGTVFELSPTAGGSWTEQVLHNFGNGTDGSYPDAGLIFDASGNLYGTTQGGGTNSTCSYYGHGDVGCGIVFELSPTVGGSWTEQVLHNFDNGPGGFGPQAGVIFDAAGNLYGTTVRGGGSGSSDCGLGGCGTVFELTPAGGGSWSEQALHHFGNGTDGYLPTAGLIFDAEGNLYGTTQAGGFYGYGTVFELTPRPPCATCSHAVLP